MYVCTCSCVYVYVCVCVYVCMYLLYMYMYVYTLCMYVCVCVCLSPQSDTTAIEQADTLHRVIRQVSWGLGLKCWIPCHHYYHHHPHILLSVGYPS